MNVVQRDWERNIDRDILGVTHITDENDGDGKDSIVRKGGATDKLRSIV